MEFHRPVLVGDELSFYATIERVGRTSMRILVEAWRRNRYEDASERVSPATLKYLNRLSDLLFVAARAANNDGAADVLWKPGANR